MTDAVNPLPPLAESDFDALDGMLDDLRAGGSELPQWEFFEGALAALLCTRRPIPPGEYLPVLMGWNPADGDGPFAEPEQAQRFLTLWNRRWNEVATALNADAQTLEDENAYHPEVLDVRGAMALLPEEERIGLAAEPVPSFAQVWALGFLFVVDHWADDWAAPRDKETAGWIEDALDAIGTLTEDDTDPPAFNMHAEDGPPSVSDARANDFGEAIWAVYDLHQIWRSLGDRTEPVRKAPEPGRNDPCPCGSGKKYKKCCGV